MVENKQKKIEFDERCYFKYQVIILIASGIAGYIFSQNFITEISVSLFTLAVIAVISGIVAGFGFGYILNRNALLVSNMASGTGFGIGIMVESGLVNGIMGGAWFFILFATSGPMTMIIIFLLRALSLLGVKNVALKAIAVATIVLLTLGGTIFIGVFLFLLGIPFIVGHLGNWFGIGTIIYSIIVVLSVLGATALGFVGIFKLVASLDRIQNKIWAA